MAAVIYSVDIDAAFENDPEATPYNNAWKQAMAAAINAAIGDWTVITYGAGNFGSASGSWTVQSTDVLLNMYQVINKTLHWVFYSQQTSVSLNTANLRIAVPTGLFDAATVSVMGSRTWLATDNGSIIEAKLAPGDASTLYITHADGSGFVPSVNNTAIAFNAFFKLA
jgi:hypothetical protein